MKKSIIILVLVIFACKDITSDSSSDTRAEDKLLDIYEIGEIKDTAGKDLSTDDGKNVSIIFSELSVSSDTATFTATNPEDSDDNFHLELPIVDGIAKKVIAPSGIIINLTGQIIYYRVQAVYVGKENDGIRNIVTDKSQSALEASYNNEYTSIKSLGGNKIALLEPNEDDTDTLIKDAEGRPTLEIYTGDLNKK